MKTGTWRRTAIAALLFGMSLLCAGCGSKAQEGWSGGGGQSGGSGQEPSGSGADDQTARADRNRQDDTAETSGYNDRLITEIYNEDGSFTDQWGNTCTYSIHVPQLQCDSEDAVRLNQRLQAEYEEMVKELHKSIEGKYTLADMNVRWESHWKDSLLTLVMVEEQPDSSSAYTVYYFDFKDGSRLWNTEVLARLNISEDVFQLAVQRAAARIFDIRFAAVDEDAATGSVHLGELRATTIGSIGNDLSTVDFYQKEEGLLEAYIPIFTPAGAGRETIVTLVSLTEYGDEKAEFEQGFPNVAADGENLHAWTTDGQRNLEFFYGNTGKYYQVAGCYSYYEELAVLEQGYGGLDYIFARTNYGFVEAVDVSDCVSFDCAVSMGPLYGIREIERLEAMDGTVYGVNREGEWYDLYEYAQNLSSSLDEILRGNGTWQTKFGDDAMHECLMTKDSYGECALYEEVPDQNIYLAYHGLWAALGMGDQGLVCGYQLTGPDGIDLQGVWSVLPLYGEMVVQEIGGDRIFEAPGRMNWKPAEE